MLMTLINLTNLSLLRNPVVKQTPKFRDQVVSLTRRQFSELNGQTIKAQERQYLEQLNARKQVKFNRQNTAEREADRGSAAQVNKGATSPFTQNSFVQNQMPSGRLQRPGSIPAMKPAQQAAAAAGMGIDGQSKKVYASGNAKIAALNPRLNSIDMQAVFHERDNMVQPGYGQN